MSDADSIQHAQLQWDDEGQPTSVIFGDVYFSRANGLEETRHVFLKHNQLAERWQALAPTDTFVIAETGFGSGLNFLAAWELWAATAPASAQLHFISVEKFPLNKNDLERALSLWPQLRDFSRALINSYPCIVDKGFYRLNFMDGRVKLTLIINDAAEGFQQLHNTPDPLFSRFDVKVDAWFLDGFAPAKNPQMWSEALFSCIHLLSAGGTTAATFSAAGIVKKGLRFAGFQINKVAGFGRKREMITATMAAHVRDYVYPQPAYKSFSPFPSPWAIQTYQRWSEKSALIIGAGIAGCTSARALADRGWQVTIIERNASIAAEASGNPQGVLYAKLSPKDEAQAEFNLACLQFAQTFYANYWPQIGDKTGVLQLAYSESEQELQDQLRQKFSNANSLVKFVSADHASELAGVALRHSALYFPEAGWINPKKLCTKLLDHPRINIFTHTEALNFIHRDNKWTINGDSSLQAPVLVIANARDAQAFDYTKHLPIKSIRGQITYLPVSSASRNLKAVVCGEGYIAPADDNIHCTGATFNLKDNTREVRAEDHLTNIENLRNPMPALCAGWESLQPNAMAGRVAFRCTLPDYLPAVGPVADELAMVDTFAPLKKNARAFVQGTGQYLPGLYINIGHGSRGLAYTPLCAEILAAHINHEPQPLANELVRALNPARFLIRDLIKNKR